MSNEAFFVLFIFVPFISVGVILAIAQQKFIKLYREIYPKKDSPISSFELFEDLQNNPQKAREYMKKNFFKFVFLRSSIYYANYSDPRLNKIAKFIRVLFIILFAFPFLGLFFLYMRS